MAPAWQYALLTTGLVLVITLGITIGSSYRTPDGNYTGLMVNDTYIEQLSIYGEHANE